MNKLSDLELIKAIAKIDGVDILHPDDRCGRGSDQGLIQEIIETSETGVWTRTKDYNPLTDKAILFELMAKHEITIEYSGVESGFCSVYAGLVASGTARFNELTELPRAILECIEANNEI